jgi:phosphoglycerate dehydrogenase-like enzyme
MPKISVTHDLRLSKENIKRLKSIGDLVIYDSRPSTPEEWLERCKDADIICSGVSGLREKYQELKDVFISLPSVGVEYLDKDILRKNNIKVVNSPGCNKEAVTEWVIGMIINLLRNIFFFTNNTDLKRGKVLFPTIGLMDKKVLILGRGNIGTRVGEICEALKMKVEYFKRGDDLFKKTKNQNVIINCLSLNESTKGILNNIFFNSLKRGGYFISISPTEVYDKDAMLNALNNDILAGVAIDDGSMNAGDVSNKYYQELLKHPKILATPHISFNTDVSDKIGNNMMIDNIEDYLADNPQFGKKLTQN